MKLGIFCNFGPPHVGGTEVVLENISMRLISQYGHDITIYGHNYSSNFKHKGINIKPCFKGDRLIYQINDNDHVFVYSDSFWGWDTIVENIEKVIPDVSVALVGAYHMGEHNNATGKKFMDNLDRFRVIVHSKGIDYKWCVNNCIPCKIIPNGVDIYEFNSNKIDFREKYDIKSQYMLLNVSNYFYGKGQESLAPISKELNKKSIDHSMVSISNTIDYPYGRSFLSRTKTSFKNRGSGLFLQDLPREDVVAAFKCADAFVFTSRKEIAPLVIIESRAAGLPWVSFDVGNVSDNGGGFIIPKRNSFNKGFIIVDDVDIYNFTEKISCILKGNRNYSGVSIRDDLKKKGKRGLDILEWNNIVPEYEKVFKS